MPIQIRDSFLSGKIIDFLLGPTAGQMRVTQGKRWIILNAIAYHVTGTDTYLIAYRGGQGARTTVLTSYIAAAEASGYYSMFNMVAEPYVQQWIPMPLTAEYTLDFDGGVDAMMHVYALEYDE